MKEPVLSKCEREFVNNALLENIRLDGRQLLEQRPIKLYFGSGWGTCLASLGQTKVVACVSSDIQPPELSRPNEGKIFINVGLNPLAAPHFEAGRQTEMGILINRKLERCFKESRCIDLESLCIVAGQKVWHIRVDVDVINYDGNVVDCASIATLAALSHFHRPDVTSTGDSVIIHSFAEKDPLPLTLFSNPICVSFTTLESGKTVMDPTYLEERLGVAQLTLGLTSYQGCSIDFTHTARSKVSIDIVSHVMNDAVKCAAKIIKTVKETVKADVQKRYNKEEANSCRFINAIATDKITAMMSERIHVKLSAWNATSDCKINKTEMDEKSEDIEMNEENTIDTIVKVGVKSAELINNEVSSIGTGGKNTWNLSESSDEEMKVDDDGDDDDEDDDDDDDDDNVNKREDKEDVVELFNAKEKKQVIESIELSDSEEEDTGTLSKDDLI